MIGAAFAQDARGPILWWIFSWEYIARLCSCLYVCSSAPAYSFVFKSVGGWLSHELFIAIMLIVWVSRTQRSAHRKNRNCLLNPFTTATAIKSTRLCHCFAKVSPLSRIERSEGWWIRIIITSLKHAEHGQHRMFMLTIEYLCLRQAEGNKLLLCYECVRTYSIKETRPYCVALYYEFSRQMQNHFNYMQLSTA